MEPDKLIHKDEFRLRVLLTNTCNKNCNFCLNDFQDKEPGQFAPMIDLIDCIRAYGSFMKYMKKESIVTFSGGEPGLYPNLSTILKNARYHCDTVKVVTNGLAFFHDRVPYVDKWHFGVTKKEKIIIDRLRLTKNIVVQTVVSDTTKMENLIDLVDFYHRSSILVKLFVDFNSERKEDLQRMVHRVSEYFNHDMVCTRFTGKQINRGQACHGCEKECVTLKALWYFPDGTSSTCPQGMIEKFDDDSWDETMEKAYDAHSYQPFDYAEFV